VDPSTLNDSFCTMDELKYIVGVLARQKTEIPEIKTLLGYECVHSLNRQYSKLYESVPNTKKFTYQLRDSVLEGDFAGKKKVQKKDKYVSVPAGNSSQPTEGERTERS